MRLPRAACPECGRDVALRVGGELREHRDESGQKCPAQGYTIAEVNARQKGTFDALRSMSDA